MTKRDTALSDYETYNRPDWDGYGADPIAPETLALARTMSNLLRNPPDAAPSGDGTIGFEWVEGDGATAHKIFMDVGLNAMSLYVRIGNLTFSMSATGKRRADGEQGDKP